QAHRVHELGQNGLIVAAVVPGSRRGGIEARDRSDQCGTQRRAQKHPARGGCTANGAVSIVILRHALTRGAVKALLPGRHPETGLHPKAGSDPQSLVFYPRSGRFCGAPLQNESYSRPTTPATMAISAILKTYQRKYQVAVSI